MALDKQFFFPMGSKESWSVVKGKMKHSQIREMPPEFQTAFQCFLRSNFNFLPTFVSKITFNESCAKCIYPQNNPRK